MKPPVMSPESYAALFDHYIACLRAVCMSHGLAPGLLLNPRLKDQGVVAARRDLVMELAETVQVRSGNVADIRICVNGEPIEPGWRWASTVLLGRWLGVCHSTIVLIQQRERKQLDKIGRELVTTETAS